MKKRLFSTIFAVAISLTLISCAATAERRDSDSADFFADRVAPQKKSFFREKPTLHVQETATPLRGAKKAVPSLSIKDVAPPASEDKSPLNSKIISLSLRHSPMKEAVYAIAYGDERCYAGRGRP